MVFEDPSVVIYQYKEELARDKCVVLSHTHRFGVNPHGHAFLELSYIYEGRVEHTLDGKSEMLYPGDYVIVDYGSRHSYANRDQTPFGNIDCLFLPELLDPALKGEVTLRAVLEHYLLHFNMRSPVQNPAHMIFHDENGRVRELIERIREELEAREAGCAELVRCYLLEILLLTLRRIEGAQSAMAPDDIGARIGAYVAEHYTEELTLAELARKMNYSLPYLSKRFKEEMGVGFAHYLQGYRVRQACRLLSTTRLSLGEIAEAVGYRDPKNLAALIKKETGLSPLSFRARRER
ncbi:MAG: helix-turn-helix domain-containing protein [Clostridia bacterium]|nr:helix-turn-helix domain-containing protein [Clostridia bacterium]